MVVHLPFILEENHWGKMTHKNATVAEVFDSYPAPVRKRLLELRDIIFAVAAKTEGVGPLEETLKWGEPSYLTSQSGSGSTIRIAQVRKAVDKFAMYFNCKTTLLDQFGQLYPTTFQFEKNRALIFDLQETLPKPALEHCIALALTYHRCKSK